MCYIGYRAFYNAIMETSKTEYRLIPIPNSPLGSVAPDHAALEAIASRVSGILRSPTCIPRAELDVAVARGEGKSEIRRTLKW